MELNHLRILTLKEEAYLEARTINNSQQEVASLPNQQQQHLEQEVFSVELSHNRANLKEEVFLVGVVTLVVEVHSLVVGRTLNNLRTMEEAFLVEIHSKQARQEEDSLVAITNNKTQQQEVVSLPKQQTLQVPLVNLIKEGLSLEEQHLKTLSKWEHLV